MSRIDMIVNGSYVSVADVKYRGKHPVVSTFSSAIASTSLRSFCSASSC
jgi:hypothetical protein